jgi:hypothetical protein
VEDRSQARIDGLLHVLSDADADFRRSYARVLDVVTLPPVVAVVRTRVNGIEDPPGACSHHTSAHVTTTSIPSAGHSHDARPSVAKLTTTAIATSTSTSATATSFLDRATFAHLFHTPPQTTASSAGAITQPA